MDIGPAREQSANSSSTSVVAGAWGAEPYHVSPCPQRPGEVLWAGSERPATWHGVGVRAGWLRMRRAEAPPAGARVRVGIRAAPFADGTAWTAATVQATRDAAPDLDRPPWGEDGASAERVDLLVEFRVRVSLRPSLFERVVRALQRR